jgi:hypothetical protein
MKGSALARPWWLLPPGRVNPLWWSGIGVLLIWFDFLAGPSAPFPVIYVIPVIVAAWYSGRRPALALAVAVPLAHIAFLGAVWAPSGDLAIRIAATIFRAAVIIVIALWFARLSEHERDIHRYVQRLEGLLAICSFCKSIRNKAGDWEPLETFISARSEAQFSHGLCPSCGRLHYPDIDLEDTFAAGVEAKQ